ncbi:MAG: methionyl-tRNA formyltransferase [Chloroflexota bacterium]
MPASTKSLRAAGSNAPLRVALMASWGLGLEILRTLIADERIAIVQVLSRPPSESDPWAGIVTERAIELGIPTISFINMNVNDLIMTMDGRSVDLLLVHAYPYKLPREVFSRPHLGTINIHPSLLPRYRGPQPTRDVLADGAKETGLTAHFMDEDYDTGDIIHQERIPVFAADTVESVIERLKTVVPALMQETVSRLLDPRFKPLPQGGMLSKAGDSERTMP